MKLRLFFDKLQVELKPPEEVASKPVVLTSRSWTVVIVLLILLSIGAWWFYFSQGLTLSYNDARSHLNVARRAVDSLQPGAAQIGSVWLPLFHVLEIPFVGNDYLWHSGVAGSIISMISFVVGGVYVLKIGERLHFDRPTLFISLGVYALNPNLLFLQSAPMTEALLITLTLATAFYFLEWVQTFQPISLIYTAFATFLATITRYDGWFLFGFVAVMVAFVGYKKKGLRFAEGNFILYCTLAGFGVFLWLLWNLVIFGHPLYFAVGPFSAKAQQDILLSEGRLITKGNFIYSFFIYLFATRYNLGNWLSILFLGGLWYISWSKWYPTLIKLAIWVLMTPLFFNVLSLVAGHSAIHLPELPPYTWFNDRYGLMMLPAAAILVGIFVNGKRAAIILAICILLIQTQIMYVGNNIITIEDGVRGASAEFQDEAGNWIRDNVQSGLILVAASSNDALMFRSGLPLKRFITEGAQKYWSTTLADPTTYADWVIMHKGDLVERNLNTNPAFLQNYRLVYHDDFSYVYKKELGSTKVITKEQLP